MDIETQCEVIQYPIKEKIFKKKKKMDWFYAVAFGSILKSEARILGNLDKASILRTYRTFLSSWSNLTGNELPVPKTLAEIFSELYTST